MVTGMIDINLFLNIFLMMLIWLDS